MEEAKVFWKFKPDEQDLLLPIALGRFGSITGKNESLYSLIYTIDTGIGLPKFLVAKAPKIPFEADIVTVRGHLIRALHEINAIHQICHHPSIHNFGRAEVLFGIPFLISPKRHATLRDVVEEGPLGIVDVLVISIQIARSIEYIQSKGIICHQDLKAENVFIDFIDEKFSTDGKSLVKHQVFLADFDLVNWAVLNGQPYGSRPYQAPEQYEKKSPVKFDKIDVFALGVNIVEMLTGGLHPLGERTTDVWPKSTKGNKWMREDPWKKWARDPFISEGLNLDLESRLLVLIRELLSPAYAKRPCITDTKERLLQILKEHDEHVYNQICVCLAFWDSAAIEGESSGWPHMDLLINNLNRQLGKEIEI